MTARVDFHIRPGVDYVHTITFQGSPLPAGPFLTEVRSKGSRLLLAPNTTLSAPSTLIVSADQTETEFLSTGVGLVTVVTTEGVTVAEGEAHIFDEGNGAETSTVPPPADGTDDTEVAITVQGIAVNGADGADGDSASDIIYVHVQAIASNEWRITHPFSKVVSVVVLDSFHEEVEPDIDYDDSGDVVIRADGAFSGEATLIGIPA